ncbi:PREDICTED: GDNF family receptor alpha-2-like [Nanorana parkeri]|uniref:GDNF family receptor alpha-2-like n=1 Tax=Nanorana parkeri TaxID=125878 RepID=UPI00085425E4|nr:PREDICTED: GDNF family receptor alpha-2-like [Nanorana parkeri]
MLPVGIILLLSHAVDFLSANSTEPFDCILAEEKCLQDSRCKVSYHAFKNCSRTNVMDQVNSVKCKEAAEVLSQNSVMQCKCQRRMKKEEHCLNIYWTLHPDYVYGYLDSYNSPYVDEKVDKKGADEHAHLAADRAQYRETNGCLKEANICSSNRKCFKLRSDYGMHCARSCDRHKCHHYLREFFKKVPMEFTKRLLFCECNQESNCAERRRQNIVPKCSFEEKVKKNCLELRDTCLSNNLCKSRFLDYLKHCQLLNKKTGSCPQENHSQCIQSYMRMIGTVMTPNFINNSTMEISLWCTCEGSGDQEDDCKNILSMFTSNKCLKSAIKTEINNSDAMDIDPKPADPFTDKACTLPVFPIINEAKGHTMQVLPVKTKEASNSASGGSSLLLTSTLLITTLFSLLKVMLSI